jgi:ribonuclease HI
LNLSREFSKVKLTIHFDGGSRGNPGPASAGVVIVKTDSGKPIHEAGYFLGRCTNNVAEYQGLLRSLAEAKTLGGSDLDIYSDSQLLVRQILGEYRVKSPDLKPLYEKARSLLGGFDHWAIQHVRREGNQRADELANLSMDHQADVSGADGKGPTTSSSNRPTLPCWSATLSGKNGKCLAGCGTGNEYPFGPTTPDGFCVHAAAAVLTDGPLQWTGKKKTGTARCAACGLNVRLQVIL